MLDCRYSFIKRLFGATALDGMMLVIKYRIPTSNLHDVRYQVVISLYPALEDAIGMTQQ